MQGKDRGRKRFDDLDARMLIVKDFISELFNKTVFQSGKVLNSDLSPSQIKSLFAFEEENKGYPIGRLGKNAQVKRSAITNMIDRLEREGIAERFRDDGDRRVVKVQLTDKGKRIRREFYQKRTKEVKKLFSKLNEEDRKALLYHLDEAYHILKRI